MALNISYTKRIDIFTKALRVLITFIRGLEF